MGTNTSKVAIVTGASRGIGRAIALRLAQDNIAVVVNYAHRASDADEVVQAIEAAGGRAIALQGDVANASDCARLFDATEAQFGGVDIVINNAGVIQPGTTMLADTDDVQHAAPGRYAHARQRPHRQFFQQRDRPGAARLRHLRRLESSG
jgi:NAD(P)-dependent dehydrogenase (short-subunit alcohol dehydrogenase family)